MDMTDYDNKFLSHLNDTTTYKTINHNPTDQFVNDIINELKLLKQNGEIPPRLYNRFFFSVVVSVPNFTVYQKYVNKVFP